MQTRRKKNTHQQQKNKTKQETQNTLTLALAHCVFCRQATYMNLQVKPLRVSLQQLEEQQASGSSQPRHTSRTLSGDGHFVNNWKEGAPATLSASNTMATERAALLISHSARLLAGLFTCSTRLSLCHWAGRKTPGTQVERSCVSVQCTASARARTRVLAVRPLSSLMERVEPGAEGPELRMGPVEPGRPSLHEYGWFICNCTSQTQSRHVKSKYSNELKERWWPAVRRRATVYQAKQSAKYRPSRPELSRPEPPQISRLCRDLWGPEVCFWRTASVWPHISIGHVTLDSCGTFTTASADQSAAQACGTVNRSVCRIYKPNK